MIEAGIDDGDLVVVKKQVEANEGETSKEDYREYFLYDKVTDYLVENAKITNN